MDSEQEILREEINSLQAVKTKLQGRIKDLEDELKKTREDIEKKNQAAQEQENEVTVYYSNSMKCKVCKISK